ncbi:MAG: hypothetical protein H0V34_13825 [Gammaproteobacteria bacterium]|nr:hypothetical protein [Gammaproteobacteria bacterium]MBA3731754.1 hypothetical protein [Gammaproteobacteria bacterium]
MKSRIIFHFVAFAGLFGAGAWIAYQGVVAPTRIGPLAINIENATIYWFTLLVYVFVWLLLYYPLRRRTWPVLLIGHASAVAIALASTFTVISLGSRNSPDARILPSESAQTRETIPPPADADPNTLTLPLPSRQGTQ